MTTLTTMQRAFTALFLVASVQAFSFPSFSTITSSLQYRRDFDFSLISNYRDDLMAKASVHNSTMQSSLLDFRAFSQNETVVVSKQKLNSVISSIFNRYSTRPRPKNDNKRSKMTGRYRYINHRYGAATGERSLNLTALTTTLLPDRPLDSILPYRILNDPSVHYNLTAMNHTSFQSFAWAVIKHENTVSLDEMAFLKEMEQHSPQRLVFPLHADLLFGTKAAFHYMQACLEKTELSKSAIKQCFAEQQQDNSTRLQKRDGYVAKRLGIPSIGDALYLGQDFQKSIAVATLATGSILTYVTGAALAGAPFAWVVLAALALVASIDAVHLSYLLPLTEVPYWLPNANEEQPTEAGISMYDNVHFLRTRKEAASEICNEGDLPILWRRSVKQGALNDFRFTDICISFPLFKDAPDATVFDWHTDKTFDLTNAANATIFDVQTPAQCEAKALRMNGVALAMHFETDQRLPDFNCRVWTEVPPTTDATPHVYANSIAKQERHIIAMKKKQ